MGLIVVVTTTESKADARNIAEQLIQQRLAACVQIVGPLESVYRWKGQVESAEEYRCEIKTTSDRFAAIQTCLNDIHPYDVPELIVLPVTQASDAYESWAVAQLAPEDQHGRD